MYLTLGGTINEPENADNDRKAFLVQVPPTVMAICLVTWTLKVPSRTSGESKQNSWASLKRIHFAGAFSLSTAIAALCAVIDLGGNQTPWKSPWIIVISATGAVAAIAFVLTSAKASEPIFPLRLLGNHAALTNYMVTLFQVTAQMSLMLAVPLYLQATTGASVATAGAYLVPTFAGNLLGGLISGSWMKRTGGCKEPTVLGPFLALGGTTMLLLTCNGDTHPAKSAFLFPTSVATGMISSSTFVALAAGVRGEDIAVSASSIYLFFNIGAIAGVSLGGALFQAGLRSSLAKSLGHRRRRRGVLNPVLGSPKRAESKRRLCEKHRRTSTTSKKSKQTSGAIWCQATCKHSIVLMLSEIRPKTPREPYKTDKQRSIRHHLLFSISVLRSCKQGYEPKKRVIVDGPFCNVAIPAAPRRHKQTCSLSIGSAWCREHS